MIMQETFDKLRALQDVLVQMYQVEKELEEIPKAILTQKETLGRSQKKYDELNGDFEKKQDKVKELKYKLKDAEEKRSKDERDMDVIKTQKEYEILDKAIKEDIVQEQQLRKDLLREEKEEIELHQEVEELALFLNNQQEELKHIEAKINAESDSKKLELDKLSKKKDSIIPGLDEDLLFKFERIIKSKEGGQGIVSVKKGICSACHMILPAQFVNDIRHGDKIEFCPYCSRILFYEECEDEDDNTMFDYRNDNIGGFAGLSEEDDEEEELDEDTQDEKMDIEPEAEAYDDETVYDDEPSDEEELEDSEFSEEENEFSGESDDEDGDEFTDDEDEDDDDDEEDEDDEDISLDEMAEDEDDEEEEDEEEN